MVFTLKDNAYTRSMWDFAFEVRYTIELGSDSLDTTFSVLNKGDAPFQFTVLGSSCECTKANAEDYSTNETVSNEKMAAKDPSVGAALSM